MLLKLHIDEYFRVPTAQGKQGKWQNKIPVRENTGNLEILSKHRELCLNTGKTQGILLAQVVNVLILKVKDIVIVAAKKACQFSSVYVILTNYVNCHRENLRSDRENTGNLKIQFEWVP